MNDIELVEKIEQNWGKLNELPEFSRIDSFIGNGHIALWVERKVRNVPFNAYPDAVVDYAKWKALIDIEEITTTPAVLAYAWSCGTWGTVQPSTCKKFEIKSLTPSLESVSLNAGVERKVVHIDLSEFQLWN